MTEPNRKADSENIMIQRMQRAPFTFSDLYMLFGGESPEYREADRLIQKMRKAGKIKQVQRGIWEWVQP